SQSKIIRSPVASCSRWPALTGRFWRGASPPLVRLRTMNARETAFWEAALTRQGLTERDPFYVGRLANTVRESVQFRETEGNAVAGSRTIHNRTRAAAKPRKDEGSLALRDLAFLVLEMLPAHGAELLDDELVRHRPLVLRRVVVRTSAVRAREL